MSSVPLPTVSSAANSALPVSVTFEPEIISVPAPALLTPDAKLKLPPARLISDPAVTLNAPLMVPPFDRIMVPPLAASVPVLFIVFPNPRIPLFALTVPLFENASTIW